MNGIEVGSRVKLKGNVSNHINPVIAELSNVHGTVRKIYKYAYRGCRTVLFARIAWDGYEYGHNIFYSLNVYPNTTLGRTDFQREINKDGSYTHWELTGLELVKENK